MNKATAPRSSTKPTTPPKTVDEYLAAVSEPVRGTLMKVRGVIKETANQAAPAEVTEVLSYGIPAFRIDAAGYKGIVMWYAAFSDHCSLFPTASVIQAFKKELEGYRVSKGTVKFSVSGSSKGTSKDKPLPAALLKKMVKARLAEMAGKKRRG